jgi:hypothetical protein
MLQSQLMSKDSGSLVTFKDNVGDDCGRKVAKQVLVFLIIVT